MPYTTLAANPYTITGPAIVNIFAAVPRIMPSAGVQLGPNLPGLTPGKIGGKIKKKHKGARTMGWKNQVICQLKGYVQAPYGGGALFFG